MKQLSGYYKKAPHHHGAELSNINKSKCKID